jgi:hypothetical protein
MLPIHRHPDDAGFIGALHLTPSWIFEAHDSILAVDIGGTNIRCGIVETRHKKASDLSEACVWKPELWRHADDEPTREIAVKLLVELLKDLIARAKDEGFKLAPFIGRCHRDQRFDQKRRAEFAGQLGKQQVQSAGKSHRRDPPDRRARHGVVIHNDGVVQGLSEVPSMQGVKRWGILTIGTGLGNARFTNRNRKGES